MIKTMTFFIFIVLLYIAGKLTNLEELQIRGVADIESMLDFISKKTASDIARELEEKGYISRKKGGKE